MNEKKRIAPKEKALSAETFPKASLANLLPKGANPWRTLNRRQVYSNPWIQVFEDSVIQPDGSPGIYGVVHPKIAVGVLAVSKNLEIYLVGQYRYPVEEYTWEIIEGGADNDEPPLDAAKRELHEEAGVQAEYWEELGGEIHLSNCFSSERGRLFLAMGLKEGISEPEPVEVLEVRKVPLEQAFDMALAGMIKDSLTLIAIHRLEHLLRNGKQLR